MLRTARWVTGTWLRDLVLFALVFVWMTQLLIPFGEATDIPKLGPFLLFLGVLFVVDMIVGRLLGKFVLKLVILAGFIFYNYYDFYSITELVWLKHWLHDIVLSVQLAATEPLDVIPEAARTTLFLFILWMLQSTIRQCLRSRGWMFAFLFLGSVGIGVMDTFFVRDASWQMVLYMLVGLAILAFMQLPAIERVARMPQRMKGWPGEWFIWTLVLALAVVGTSAAVPKKQDPSWPDPVSFLENKYGDAPGRQKIGYGNNDSQLGGPFEMDDTVVFTVTTAGEGYYRGEVKPVYTGRGWVSNSMGFPITTPEGLTPYQRIEETGLDTKEIKQTYRFQQPMVPVVFNQYRVTGLQSASRNLMDMVGYSDLDSRLEVREILPGDEYEVVSQVPLFEEAKLKAAEPPRSNPGVRPYLQLPESLPPRVRELAAQITRNAGTYYEKVTALETYLRQNYTYNTEEVGVPEEGQDYVDQFLFETKQGYCDNFSTSMVVMARSLGIPARWVKGFTNGTPDLSIRSEVEDEYTYVVRNRNAHSWPEIYFEGAGWVAFEPTSNFTMARDYKEQQASAPLPLPAPAPQKELEQEDDAAGGTAGGWSLDLDWATVGQYALVALGAGLIAVFINRRKILTAYYLRRAYNSNGDVMFHAIVRLLLIMEKFGWRRQQDMTMREYADYLAGTTDLRGREMIPLAKIFERTRYGQQELNDKDKGEVRDLWTRIVRKAGRLKRK